MRFRQVGSPQLIPPVRPRSLRATSLGALVLGFLLLSVTGTARAQDSTSKAPAKPPAKAPAKKKAPKKAEEPPKEERANGLPKKVKWTFNFDAGLGAFGFSNSLYNNPKPDPSGDLSDNWVESFAKPALSASYPLKNSELYGKASVVGERTFAAPPPLVGSEASSFQIEDAYLGWRSGTKVGKTENMLDFTVGRTPYTIGHGFILWDGGGEGGTRGGYWSNARKAWQFASVARLHTGRHRVEGFYLDRDEVPESDSHTRLAGGNYELSLGAANTIGASYLHFWAFQGAKPLRDGMNVFNLRAFVSPFKKLPDLALEGEVAHEANGDLLSSTAWTVQGSYTLAKVGWTPRISYRFAFFQGDEANTAKNEGFDPLLPGFYDWGTWWQGEIAGEYFLSNSNLVSHEIRVHLTPSAKVGTGVIGYVFHMDAFGTLPPTVTSKSLATELDGYCDWKINGNFTASFVAAWAHPQEAVQQITGRTKDFVYGMVYLAYSY
jgi:hypothetical protein